MKYKVVVKGYGCHLHIRRIEPEIYEFWSKQDTEATRSHLFEDSYSNINGNPIWDDENPLFLGMAKSKRQRLIEVFGPRPDHTHVQVFDENDKVVYKSSEVKDDPRFTMECKLLGKGHYLKGVREVKGTFFTGYLEEDTFSEHLLNLSMVKIDGESLMHRVEYGRKTLENEHEDTGIITQEFEFHNNP